MQTLTQIQDEYIAKLNGARKRAVTFKLRKAVPLAESHYWQAAMKQLLALGFDCAQAAEILRDARDMADLMMVTVIERSN